MSRKLLGDSAALLQSPIKWYNEKKSSLDLGLLDGYVDSGHALAKMKVERNVSVINPLALSVCSRSSESADSSACESSLDFSSLLRP